MEQYISGQLYVPTQPHFPKNRLFLKTNIFLISRNNHLLTNVIIFSESMLKTKVIMRRILLLILLTSAAIKHLHFVLGKEVVQNLLNRK